jgi:hypothetical protein
MAFPGMQSYGRSQQYLNSGLTAISKQGRLAFVLPHQSHGAMTATEPQPAAPCPKLRWYQFRLRSLLTLLVAIGMSYVGVTMRNQRKQHEVAEEIVNAGGIVQSEPTWLGKLLRDDSLVRVTEVGFNRESAADADLVHLQGLSQLQSLHLISNTKVTDAGLVHLQGLSQLQWLQLDNTRITDAGLVHLQGLSQLRSLQLSNTKVTDAGLVYLQGLRQLKTLWLFGTNVTDQGVEKLQQALPKCHIVR